MRERGGEVDVDRLAGEVASAGRAAELSAGRRRRTSALGRAIDRVAEALAVSLLGTIVLMIFANAASRYLLNRPLVWTEEVVAALVIWLAVAGAFLALRRRELMRVQVLLGRLPPRPRAVSEAVVHLFSAMVFAYVAWQGWRYLGVFGGDKTPYFGLPKGVYMAALPIGGLAIALAFLLEARQATRERA